MFKKHVPEAGNLFVKRVAKVFRALDIFDTDMGL